MQISLYRTKNDFSQVFMKLSFALSWRQYGGCSNQRNAFSILHTNDLLAVVLVVKNLQYLINEMIKYIKLFKGVFIILVCSRFYPFFILEMLIKLLFSHKNLILVALQVVDMKDFCPRLEKSEMYSENQSFSTFCLKISSSRRFYQKTTRF